MSVVTTKINILKINEVEFKIDSLPKGINNINPDKLLLAVHLAFKKAEEDNTIFLYPGIRYQYGDMNDIDNAKVLLEVLYQFKYEIISNDKKFIIDNEKISIDEDIIELLVVSSFASMRGVIAVKAASSYLEDYPFPLFDRKQLVASLGIDKYKKKTTKKKTTKSKNVDSPLSKKKIVPKKGGTI